MEGRKTNDYIEVLRKICNTVKLQPAIAIADFERAERKALEMVFPGIKVIGCFFHYSQVTKDNTQKYS